MGRHTKPGHARGSRATKVMHSPVIDAGEIVSPPLRLCETGDRSSAVSAEHQILPSNPWQCLKNLQSERRNLRSLWVLVVFGLTAYATMRGILAVPRVWLSDVLATQTERASAIATAPAVIIIVGTILLGIIAMIVLRAKKVSITLILSGLAIGSLVPASWYLTGVLAFDEFDPVAPVSLTFTAPIGNSLQYLMTFTGASANFGIVVDAGTLTGAFVMAAIRRDFQADGFTTPRQFARYGLGAALMGFGGVTALGCTVGAGLSGVSTLSLASIVGLLSIVGGLSLGARLNMAAVASHSIPTSRVERAEA